MRTFAKDAFDITLVIGDKVLYPYEGTMIKATVEKINNKTIFINDGFRSIRVDSKKVAYVGRAF